MSEGKLDKWVEVEKFLAKHHVKEEKKTRKGGPQVKTALEELKRFIQDRFDVDAVSIDEASSDRFFVRVFVESNKTDIRDVEIDGEKIDTMLGPVWQALITIGREGEVYADNFSVSGETIGELVREIENLLLEQLADVKKPTLDDFIFIALVGLLVAVPPIVGYFSRNRSS